MPKEKTVGEAVVDTLELPKMVLGEDNKYVVSASNISIAEATEKDMYLTISMRMFSTQVNSNKEAVTEEFIDDVVNAQDAYTCMPLYADTARQKSRDYSNLGHMVNRKTGQFYTSQIGSFFKYEKVNDEYGVSLVGHARVPKRDEAICAAIMEMYEKGILSFSFEIYAPDRVLQGDVTYVAGGGSNYLMGMAVVSVPACKEAVALALVAEKNTEDEKEFTIPDSVICVADIDLSVVRTQLRKIVYDAFGDESYYWEPMFIGHSSMVVYNVNTGQMIQMNYVVEENKVEIVDFYEVEFKNKSAGVDEMDLEKALAKIEELNENIATLNESMASNEQAIAEKDTRIAELDEAIASLNDVKTKYDEMIAEREAQELSRKKDMVRKFAELNKLDVDDEIVASAIENLDFQLIIESAVVVASADEEEDDHTPGIIDEIKVSSMYGGILDPLN